jgi:hypothetical protein
MVKIVILGSCRFEPYEILAVPKSLGDLHNTEEGYRISTLTLYPAIEKADIVIVYIPDGLGNHTKRDLEYTQKLGKKIILIEG